MPLSGANQLNVLSCDLRPVALWMTLATRPLRPIVWTARETLFEPVRRYLLVGIVVGVLARLLVPGRSRIGILGTLAVGVIGAVGGGWLAGTAFPETAGVDWIASILVAMVLVLLVRAAARRRIL